MKSKSKKQDSRVKYPGAQDLEAILKEIARNVEDALSVARIGKGRIALDPDMVDALRCIVEDSRDKLEVHYEALDEMQDAANVERADKK